MFRKNTAGQFIHFQGVDATTGGIKSGVTWTVRRCIDGTFAAATGTVTEDGTTGWYKFAMSQADTNGNDIAFNFTGTGAVPQTVNIVTTACDPTSNSFGLSLAKTTNITGFNDITVANIWQDTTAGDFTVANSIGKSIMNGVSLGTGLTIASVSGAVGSVTGAVGSVTGNVGGNVVGSVGSVAGNVGGNVVGSVASVTARVTANTDQLAGQTVTAAAGVTFPSSVASPTNITAGTITTATNVTTVNGLAAGIITAASIAADAITAAKIADGAIDTATFAAGTTIPRVTLADTLTTYTGNTPQTGDAYARIGATGSGLTSLAQAATALSNVTWTDARAAKLDNLDATVSSRLASSSYATPLDAAGTRAAVGLATANLDTQLAGLASGTVAPSWYSSPLNAAGTRAAVGLASANLDTQLAAIDGHVLTRLPASTYTAPLDAAGTRAAVGLAAANLDTQLAALDADVLSRLASSAYVAPNNAGIASIKLKTDNLPTNPAATGDAMTLTSGERDAVAAALMDLANGIEPNLTFRIAMKLITAVLLGKTSGGQTAFRDYNDTVTRVTATLDGAGDRTEVTRYTV